MEREGRTACSQLRRDVQVHLADLVRGASRRRGPRAICVRVRERAIRLRDAGAAGIVVSLVSGDNEEGVALVDAVIGETLEEGGKGVVVRLELRLVVGFPRPRGAREVRIEWRWEGGCVVVVRVRDVGIG